MKQRIWDNAISACPDPQRAAQFLDRLRNGSANGALQHAAADSVPVLAGLLAGSLFAAEQLTAHPEWVAMLLDADGLRQPRTRQGFHREVEAFLGPALEHGNFSDAYARLRTFKQKEAVRIAARDLARMSNVIEITMELSDLADVCLESVFRLCWGQLTAKRGEPWHLDAEGAWRPTRFSVIGLGKHGGQELNFSSDVDVMFIYTEEGCTFSTPPAAGDEPRGFTNHQFFMRLGEMFCQEVGRTAPEGQLYRIDARLRPEGDSGPLVRSLSSYENYYAQWGQTFERLMLLKARCVAGDGALAGEFIEAIQSFRYPRLLSRNVLEEIGRTKLRIENEVVREGELDRNVKLGRGGIREIEFVAQALQMLHGGRTPFLQNPQTLPALDQLHRYNLLKEADAHVLKRAYCFLRDVEHRLQMDENHQTHTIPTARHSRERLARLMGYDGLSDFEEHHDAFRREVRGIYDRLFNPDGQEQEAPIPDDFDVERERWLEILRCHSFREPERAWKLFREFAMGPGFIHVSRRTTQLAMQLIPQFLGFCMTLDESLEQGRIQRQVLSDPDRVLARLDAFVSAYGARNTLYEIWNHNPKQFEVFLFLFDRSEFLAEQVVRTPDLVDELEQGGHLRRQKTAELILRDLRFGRNDPDQKAWMRKYHQVELARLGVRDILGLADFEQNLVELSALAEACLEYALEVVVSGRRISECPVAIIGLGKLGGGELTYGSDLDIVFVAEEEGFDPVEWPKLAQAIVRLVSDKTAAGNLFETDTRLRPDGKDGMLVNSLTACEDYYRKRAQLWEIQALSRARFVAGNIDVGKRFIQMARALCDFTPANVVNNFSCGGRTGLKCHSPGWETAVIEMRDRIEKERTPAGREPLAFKTGAGGLIDCEFLAQTLSLRNGWYEPNTMNALTRAGREGIIEPGPAETLMENFRLLRHLESVLRRWSYEGEVILPDRPDALRRVAIRCGYRNAEVFLEAVMNARVAIRRVFDLVMKRPNR